MIRINLAPSGAGARRPAVRFRLPSPGLGLVFAVVYGLAVLGLAGYWWSLSREATRLDGEVSRGSAELTTLKATIGQGSKVKDQLAELKKRVEAIGALTRNQTHPLALLDAFADTVPRDLWITGLEEKAALLHISGSAFSTTAVADFMSNLKSSGKFKDVDIVVSRQDVKKTPRMVTFEVVCRFEG